MSALEKISHIHEYERSKDSKEYYRCIHPDCHHYQKRTRLEGKRAVCHKCKNTFILTWQQLRNRHPVCEFCTRSPKSAALREARSLALASVNELPAEIQELLIENTLE